MPSLLPACQCSSDDLLCTGRIAKRSVSHVLASTMDFMPTLAALAGVALPTDRQAPTLASPDTIHRKRHGRCSPLSHRLQAPDLKQVLRPQGLRWEGSGAGALRECDAAPRVSVPPGGERPAERGRDGRRGQALQGLLAGKICLT